MLRLAFDFIITWRETRTRPNAYASHAVWNVIIHFIKYKLLSHKIICFTPYLEVLKGCVCNIIPV